MTTTIKPIKLLYDRLKKIGFKRTYVQKYGFPDWWEDRYAADPAMFYEAKLFLIRHFGLDLSSVLDDSKDIIPSRSVSARLKTNRNHTVSQEGAAAQSLSSTLAEIATIAMDTNYQPLPSSGLGIREEILSQGNPWVGFEDLLIYLWKKGIPVLFFANHPKPVGMDGMVTRVDTRPVIIITRNEKHQSRQLFILAHEVAHIALGHIQDNESITDNKNSEANLDPEEQEANSCAIEIITGNGDVKFDLDYRMNSAQLAHSAMKYGREHHIDPGHVALNYGKSHGQMPAATGALNIIENSSAPAQEVFFRYLVENINPDLLSEDSYSFLMRLCENPGEQKA